MTSLGYLAIFIDDDVLFAAHACAALHRLALAVPDGVTRLAEGSWVGLPLLERLSALACQQTAALELLETLAKHSPSTRVAMCSLAATLAVPPFGALPVLDDQPDQPASESGNVEDYGSRLQGNDVVMAEEEEESEKKEEAEKSEALEMEPMKLDQEHSESFDVAQIATDAGSDESAKVGWAAQTQSSEASAMDVTDGERAEAADLSGTRINVVPATPEIIDQETTHHRPDNGGAPSWVECYHELRDELAVGEAGQPEEAPATSCAGLVALGNFQEVAAQVPVTACLALLPETLRGEEGDGSILTVSAVPAIWNPRFADAADAVIAVDDMHELGTPEWCAGKEGTVVLLPRSMIQRAPAAPDWATAVWLCAEAGVSAVVVVNDLRDDGPGRPAFRMGLFGSPPPPITAFMINGHDGDAIKDAVRQAPSPLRASVRTIKATTSRDQEADHAADSQDGKQHTGASHASPPWARDVPPWPLVLRAPQDLAQAWSLLETVHRAVPSPEQESTLDALALRMGLPEKRVWLTRRLQRHHRGDADTAEPVEPNLAFVECDRAGDQLQQLRRQLAEKTGLMSSDITGEFEVRFREESSVGSAVMREWMDVLAQQAFLAPAHCLLVSYDGRASFLPDPAAPFVNPQWRGDFELLGRLVGLAIWHQVTLDLPLHPIVCNLLLRDGEPPEASDLAAERLRAVDEDLHRNKVQWLLSNDVSALGFDMLFTDALCVSPPAPAESAAGEASEGKGDDEVATERLPEIVGPEDILPGDVGTGEPLQLRVVPSSTQVMLVPGGSDRILTEDNKHEYVAALADWRLWKCMEGQVQAMGRGLRAVVPPAVLLEARRMLSAEQLAKLLAGLRDIDADDWERNSRTAGGLTPESKEVKWFWRVVHQYASDGRQDLLQNLLQFATGSRRVPVGGFAQLVGFNGGKHLFTLAKGSHLSAGALPTSHACICTIDLPPWETLDAAQRKLSAAVEAGHTRFDEGTARDD